MKIFKKILLIIIGILLSLVVLEIGLQIAGFTLTTIKKYQNKVTKDPNTITILCLGESTTDGQWPPILQKILNKKSKNKKFNVIDEGHSARNSEYLFHEVVEKKLLKYNPNIVISMMGANDVLSNKPYIMQNTYWYYNFKIYQLIVLIQDHICKKRKYSKLNYAELNIHVPDDTIAIIENIAKKNNITPKDLTILKEIRTKYKNIHYYESMIPALVIPYCQEKFLKTNKTNDMFRLEDFLKFYNLDITDLELGKVYICLAKWFFKNNNINNAVLCAKTAIEYGGDYKTSLKDILKFDNSNIPIDAIYMQNNICKTYEITTIIYNYMIEYIFNNGVKTYIAMQYPTISIEELKENLKNNKYYDKLVFISNEENFKQALQEHKLEEIFRDMFGGSFGHCTELGNTIIAENIAETILKLYN